MASSFSTIDSNEALEGDQNRFAYDNSLAFFIGHVFSFSYRGPTRLTPTRKGGKAAWVKSLYVHDFFNSCQIFAIQNPFQVRSTYKTQLAKMGFAGILDLTADIFIILFIKLLY